MKKLLSLTLALIIIVIIPFSVVQASSSETIVLGSVQPTIIKVSAPANVLFSINPNEKEDLRFIASKVEIKNDTNAAVEVSISKGGSNFALETKSTWKPVDTAPDAFDWSSLGMTGSESYIALGITADGGSWKNIKKEEPLYVQEQAVGTTDTIFGSIIGNSTALLSLVCNHGLSFTQARECVYRIVWTFSLSE